MRSANPSNPTGKHYVFIIDDDARLRDSTTLLLQSVDLNVMNFASASEFLEFDYDPELPACILMDVRMPGVSGLEAQILFNEKQILCPVIIMTAHADVPVALQAMKSGAFDFVEKPYHTQSLIDKIQQALQLDRSRAQEYLARKDILQRYHDLTARERQVFELVIQGLQNKQVAAKLDISIKTTEIHRANVMRKMQAANLAHLVTLAHQNQLAGPK